MRNYKLSQKFIFAFFFCLFSLNSNAAQWATVIAEKAIIYSDLEMSSAIGFVSKGKKVRVGEVARSKGRLLPIVVSNKIAYIHLKDIQAEDKYVELTSATERLKKQAKIVKDQSQLALTGGTFFSTTSSAEFGTENAQTYTTGGFNGYYENKLTDSIYRSGLHYSIFTEEQTENVFTFSYLSIPIDFYFSVIETRFYDFLVYAGLNIIPFAEYKLGTDYTLNGYGGGANAGAEMIFNLTSRISIHVESGYQYNYITGFEFPQVDNNPETASFTLTGLKTLASLSYKY